MSLDGVQNSDFRNNIIVDTHHHGIRAYQEDGAQGPKGLRIVNNTISAPAGNAVKTSEDSGASIVFNNILSGRDGATSSASRLTPLPIFRRSRRASSISFRRWLPLAPV